MLDETYEDSHYTVGMNTVETEGGYETAHEQLEDQDDTAHDRTEEEEDDDDRQQGRGRQRLDESDYYGEEAEEERNYPEELELDRKQRRPEENADEDDEAVDADDDRADAGVADAGRKPEKAPASTEAAVAREETPAKDNGPDTDPTATEGVAVGGAAGGATARLGNTALPRPKSENDDLFYQLCAQAEQGSGKLSAKAGLSPKEGKKSPARSPLADEAAALPAAKPSREEDDANANLSGAKQPPGVTFADPNSPPRGKVRQRGNGAKSPEQSQQRTPRGGGYRSEPVGTPAPPSASRGRRGHAPRPASEPRPRTAAQSAYDDGYDRDYNGYNGNGGQEYDDDETAATEDLLGSVRDEIEALADQMSVATGKTGECMTEEEERAAQRQVERHRGRGRGGSSRKEGRGGSSGRREMEQYRQGGGYDEYYRNARHPHHHRHPPPYGYDPYGYPLPPPPPPGAHHIEASLALLARKTDTMAETFRQHCRRVEVLERENEALRGVVRRLAGERSPFMGDLLKAVGGMSLLDGGAEEGGSTTHAVATAGRALQGAEPARSNGKIGTPARPLQKGEEGAEEENASTPPPAAASTDEGTASASANDGEGGKKFPEFMSPGSEFVVDLVEVMSLQAGHYGELANIMDHQLLKEAEGEADEEEEVKRRLLREAEGEAAEAEAAAAKEAKEGGGEREVGARADVANGK